MAAASPLPPRGGGRRHPPPSTGLAQLTFPLDVCRGVEAEWAPTPADVAFYLKWLWLIRSQRGREGVRSLRSVEMRWLASAEFDCLSCCNCSRDAETSLADACIVCGRKPPRFVFFAVSGSLCNIAQLALDRMLLAILPEDIWWIPTACWTLSYTLSVSLRHASHAFFVFGQHVDPACTALGKT